MHAGMKRPFSVERQSLGMVAAVLEEEEARSKAKQEREQADTPSASQQISTVRFLSHFKNSYKLILDNIRMFLRA